MKRKYYYIWLALSIVGLSACSQKEDGDEIKAVVKG